MSVSVLARHPARASAFAFGTLVLTLALAACGSDSSTGVPALPASTEYRGVGVADDGTSGKIELTFASAIADRVSEGSGVRFSVQPGTNCPSVCGYFMWYAVTGGLVDGQTITITFTDGTTTYTATGTLTGGRLKGHFSGGGKHGDFSAYASQSATDVVTYCGQWSSNTNNSTGSWLLLTRGTEATGSFNAQGQVGDLDGSVAGGTVTLHSTPAGVNATGSIPGTGGFDISGTWTAASSAGSDSGIWGGYNCDDI